MRPHSPADEARGVVGFPSAVTGAPTRHHRRPAATGGPAAEPQSAGELPLPLNCASSEIDVPLGRRVMVLGDLLLPCQASPSSTGLVDEIVHTLDEWSGPGIVVICGTLLASSLERCAGSSPSGGPDAPPPDAPGQREDPLDTALAAHPALARSLQAFATTAERRVLFLPGEHERVLTESPAAVRHLSGLHIELAATVDLRLHTAAGERRVLVHPGSTPAIPGNEALERARPWLVGIERLEDPEGSGRFVTSRILYRRLGRFIPWLALPIALPILLRLPFIDAALGHIMTGRSGAGGALNRAYEATWASRLLLTAGIMAVELLVLTVVLAIISRRVWSALGGEPLAIRRRRDVATDPEGAPLEEPGTWSGDETALDLARSLVAEGATGLVMGGSLHSELVHLDPGFFARPGGTTELVREHRGRWGLPPTFLPHQQVGWVELETGADLHVRLLHADADLPSSTALERVSTGDHVVKGRKPTSDLHPTMVASWPRGTAWPPPPDLSVVRRRSRRARLIAATSIFLAGLLDVLVAVTPPLRSHLQAVEQYLPLRAAEAAGALVALAGLAMMMLARGVLRGQRRAWIASVGLLVATSALHLARGEDVDSLLITLAVLTLLVVERSHFRGRTDRLSTRSAAVTLLGGAAAATIMAFSFVELSDRFRHHRPPAWPTVLLATSERLIGVDSTPLPRSIDRFMSPTLMAVGIMLALVALYLVTRPVVDRGLSSGLGGPARRAAELRARDIVRRHGSGTLDYFALRDDKRWFFHRDSLVAYAVYGGVCLVSPDPIGPHSDRAQVWSVFRQYADRHGWTVAVMAASEEWLPAYRESGMRFVYIGDEAVVDLATFSLAGGKMKGLRQAYQRVGKKGYTALFLDPSQVEPEMAMAVAELMGLHRRGEAERGFSMTLSRIFDPRDTGLLLTVVLDPEGRPAAICQFVPSPVIAGFSLDLMRRDPGEHPNGLLDFALCATIEHLRSEGARGISLNFAAMRSVLDSEGTAGLAQRVERWALRRMSDVFAIESLWKFNEKYRPSWIPRYIVYDSPERLAPTVAAIVRAESLSEMPVIGRFLAAPPSAEAQSAASVAAGSIGSAGPVRSAVTTVVADDVVGVGASDPTDSPDHPVR